MPNPKYIPQIGFEYLRLPRFVLDYPAPNTVTGQITEVTAVLRHDGQPAELRSPPAQILSMNLVPADFAGAVPLVNPDTDVHGADAFPLGTRQAWAGAILAGLMPTSLTMVGVLSEARKVQYARDTAEAAPPEEPAP